MEFTVEHFFPAFSEKLDVSVESLQQYLKDLRGNKIFLDNINKAVKDVPEFHGKQFKSVDELRVFRCLMYLVVRIAKPKIMIETGNDLVDSWFYQYYFTHTHRLTHMICFSSQKAFTMVFQLRSFCKLWKTTNKVICPLLISCLIVESWIKVCSWSEVVVDFFFF